MTRSWQNVVTLISGFFIALLPFWSPHSHGIVVHGASIALGAPFIWKGAGSAVTLYWYTTPGIVAESDLNGNTTSEYVFFNGLLADPRNGYGVTPDNPDLASLTSTRRHQVIKTIRKR